MVVLSSKIVNNILDYLIYVAFYIHILDAYEIHWELSLQHWINY